MLLTEKDIIAENQRFSDGTIVNKGSLNYAVATAQKTRSWTRGCALVVRALLVDHAFKDGNKRTALMVVAVEAYNNGHEIDAVRLVHAFRRLAAKPKGLVQIDEVIQDAVR